MRSMTHSPDENKSVVRQFLADTHGNRLDDFEQMVAPDVVLHGFPGGDPRDRDEYRQFFVALNEAFPDMRFDVLAMVAEGELVATHFRVRGTHLGAFAGMPASGNPVDFTGMVIYRVQGGRIQETWLQPDTLSMLQQMAPAALSATA
jgi:steroid delta-isomerase-like uncharacterized protein